jgi:hypothetical protein
MANQSRNSGSSRREDQKRNDQYPFTDSGPQAANNPDSEDNVYAEATTGLGYEPESDDQRAGQAQQQSDTTRSQNRGREQAGQVPGQQGGQTSGEDFEHASGMTGYYGGTTQEEQEGQKVNVEQAHQSNTAQYTGKPGVKAPSPGQEQGTAWSQDMELGNENVPAREPDSY